MARRHLAFTVRGIPGAQGSKRHVGHGHEDFEVCFHASDIRSRLIEPEWRQDAP